MWLVSRLQRSYIAYHHLTNAGALPPLASVTAVRVVNFSTYNAAKHRISDFVQRMTGESPLAIYNQPGSTPTVSTLATFTAAGLFAGLVSSPLACKCSQIS